MSHVYAVCDGMAVKFGMADNPRQRLAEIQTGSSSRLAFIWVIPCVDRDVARVLERMIHAHLAAERVRGEWFSGPETVRLSQRLKTPAPDDEPAPGLGSSASQRVAKWRTANRERYNARQREYMRRRRGAA